MPAQRLAPLALVALLFASPALAGVAGPFSCPDRAPLAVTAPAPAASKCQKAISKESAKFVKTKTKTLSKCLLKSAPGSCPSAQDVTKIEKAALKASDKIAKSCADDARQAALASSYSALQDEAVIGSCLLSQGNATAEILVANATGVSTEPLPLPGLDNKARGKCVKEANKRGVGFALGVQNAIAKCLDKGIKQGVANLAETCIGSFSGGVLTPATDEKTAKKIDKLVQQATSALDKKCGPGAETWLPSVFACGGSESAVELENCLLCEGWAHAVDLIEQQYAETGSYVPSGTSIEDAVNAAPEGEKLLIAPGDYAEQVTIETDGLSLVGCGGATNDRPRLVRPEGPGPFPRGIFAAGVDGLHFQSLEVVNWDDDGIFVQGAEGGVSFRDVIGDGALNSTYAIFPIESNNVLIEGCVARNVADAGLYVGQSTDIVLRYNRVEDNVAGLEIENSINAHVHNTFATANTGGILVFKLPGLPMQESRDHVISHNVSDDNNTPNFASGGAVAAVPRGTGYLILSNDDSLFEYNVARGNDSFGFLMVDQLVVNFIEPGSFDPTSPDQKVENNLVRANVFTGNGLNTAVTGFAGDAFFFLLELEDHGNCFLDNLAPLSTPSPLTCDAIN